MALLEIHVRPWTPLTNNLNHLGQLTCGYPELVESFTFVHFLVQSTSQIQFLESMRSHPKRLVSELFKALNIPIKSISSEFSL